MAIAQLYASFSSHGNEFPTFNTVDIKRQINGICGVMDNNKSMIFQLRPKTDYASSFSFSQINRRAVQI